SKTTRPESLRKVGRHVAGPKGAGGGGARSLRVSIEKMFHGLRGTGVPVRRIADNAPKGSARDKASARFAGMLLTATWARKTTRFAALAAIAPKAYSVEGGVNPGAPEAPRAISRRPSGVQAHSPVSFQPERSGPLSLARNTTIPPSERMKVLGPSLP